MGEVCLRRGGQREEWLALGESLLAFSGQQKPEKCCPESGVLVYQPAQHTVERPKGVVATVAKRRGAASMQPHQWAVQASFLEKLQI